MLRFYSIKPGPNLYGKTKRNKTMPGKIFTTDKEIPSTVGRNTEGILYCLKNARSRVGWTKERGGIS